MPNPAASGAVVSGERQLVLFLDECIPERVATLLSDLLRERPERPRFVHLYEFYRAGTPDETWIEQMRLRSWLPLTADRGRSSNGPKLPRLCRELGVVHVALSASVHALTAPDKALAIAACWLGIVDLWRNPSGCVHSLRYNDNRLEFKLVDRATGRARPTPGPPSGSAGGDL